MDSSIQFLLAVIAIVAVGLVAKVGPGNLKDFLATRNGKGILKGIVLAAAFAAVFAAVGFLSGCAGGSYLNHASVYAGLEDTRQESPMCSNPNGDQTTSNLGLRGSLYQSADERFSANAKYTHHSCAFADDGQSYDALGIELDYRFWGR